MYQNPDKYDKTLQDIVRKVYEAAPLFKERLDQLNSIINRYSKLCKEEEELSKQKISEVDLYENGDEKCNEIKESTSICKGQYENAVEQLKNTALKEAKLAVMNGRRPLIFSLKKFEGQTELINNTRIRSRLISLKSKIIEKMDILRELQRNVYCFDEFSNSSDYNSISDFDFQNFFSNDADLWTTQNASQHILEHFQTQYQRVPRIPQRSITSISKSISPSIEKIESPDSIPLNLASFKSQHLRKEMSNYQFNSYLTNAVSKFEKISESEKSTKEKIYMIYNDINDLFQKRQEFLKNFYSSCTDSTPVKIISCISTLTKCSEELRKSQTVIDTLNILLSTNASIPTSIWNNDHQIRYKMKQLLRKIDQITNLLSKTQRFVKIEPFGYNEPKEQIEIEEISSTQINQCRELISELQESLASYEMEKYSALEEIADTVNDLEKIKQIRKEEESIEISENSHEKDLNANSTNNFSFIEDEELQEILQKRAIFLEKQNEELRNLMELVNSLPDELKEVGFNQEDIDFKPKPLPVIQLPQVLSDDDDNSNNAFQLSYSQSSLTDEISEINTKLIEQIKAKAISQRASIYQSNLQDDQALQTQSSDLQQQQEQKVKVVKNDELESILKSIQPAMNPFHQMIRPEPLIEKKSQLIEYINKIPEKLSHVQALKSDIENSERTIKSFPNFKEKKMKELERKKEIINDLKEQIKEKENSDEYMKYRNICDQIDSIKEDYEGINNE